MDLDKISREMQEYNRLQQRPRKQKAKPPKRDHIGYDPELTPLIKRIVAKYKKQDPHFSRNQLIRKWVEEELK